MSGVYIKGMEMPKNCYECLVRNQGFSGDGMKCGKTGSILSWYDGNRKRMDNCPLVSVADVRPVVLCKDCKHRPIKKDGRIIAPKDANGYTDYECPFVCEDSWYNRMPADDDYCSRGEKREES